MGYISKNEVRGFYVCDTLPDGAEDFTSIEILDSFGYQNIGNGWISDFKKLRTRILAVALNELDNNYNNFMALSIEKRKIICKWAPNWFASWANKFNPAFYIATTTTIEREFNKDFFLNGTRRARQSRLDAAIAFMFDGIAECLFVMDQAKNYNLTADGITRTVNLFSDYIDGFEKQSEDFRFGLIDFVSDVLPVLTVDYGSGPVNLTPLPLIDTIEDEEGELVTTVTPRTLTEIINQTLSILDGNY